MIRGHPEYKVAWHNPLVGEDLLSECEVKTRMLHSLTWSDCFFLLFVWGWKNSRFHTKENAVGLATQDYTM